MEETGASAPDVIRAYVVVREAFGLPALWRSVEALDNQLPTTAQTTVYLEVRRLVDRAVRWLVTNRRSPLDVTAEIARLKPALSKLLPELAELVRGRERETLLEHARALVERSIPPDVADAATRVMYSFGLLDVAEVAQQTGHDLTEVAGVYFVLSERFRVDDLLSKISALPREDRWETLARMALRYDLYAALAALTIEVLAATGPRGDGRGPGDAVGAGERDRDRPRAQRDRRVRRRPRRPGPAVGAPAPDPHPGQGVLHVAPCAVASGSARCSATGASRRRIADSSSTTARIRLR